MLLPRWQETHARFRDRPALFDGDDVVSFDDLARALEGIPVATAPVIASGSALDIALATLRGWRDHQPVLPLEKPGAIELDSASIPEGIAHLKLTPGSDGQPRTVRFTADQIAADADRLVAAMGLRPEVPNLATISLSHSYGYSSIILPMLLHGIPLQNVEVPFPAVVVEAWRKHARVVVPAVPSMWRAWQRSGILADAPIELAISAGAPLPLELEETVWNEHGLKLHNFYGASECGGISWDASEKPRTHAGDLGEPLPGVSVETDDESRFVIRSNAVALGYDRLRSGETLGDGEFLTPDCGHFENGRLTLDSRAGGHINVAGRKVGAGRIESILRETGGLTRVRVFGVPSHDPDRVDEVAALIPVGTQVSATRTAAATQLAGWEMPRHWIPAENEAWWSLSRQDLRQRFTG
ncbi:acyl-CoA synthetase ligase [Haloferula helveola]|uniref:Acyl-CoA synthetase ligase n=1 Tax=Haloferula helveola TaxID=490095 RepID=A0ABN6HC86_9BACT|nr:acyl-CoA synthetase ligase [Haloferula helveola]